MELSNCTMIITGAASGFGREMAAYFIGAGSKVVAIDIDKEALVKLIDTFPSIESHHCDVSKNEEVEHTVESIFQNNKSVNVLINNAGIMKNALLVNLISRTEKRHPVELWDKVIAVNQSSVFYMTRSVVDKMINNRTKGVIINISSISAKGNLGQTAYSASKAAVESMTMVWSKELGRFGIRSVAIAPGFINTAGTHEAIEEKMLSQWIEKTPLRRTGTIEEVVRSVKFAIENDFINGEVINLNGGLTI